MKKRIVKTLSVVLCMIMMLSAICVSAESYVTLYAEDGRYKAFPASKVNAQLTVGWYREPVQRLYAEGKSKVFPQSQVQAQLTVGWYTEPVQRLYAEGKSKVFPKSQVQAQLTVGWYTEPVQRLYAPGKSKLFKKSQVAAQLTVGWYTTPVTTNYSQNTAPKPTTPATSDELEKMTSIGDKVVVSKRLTDNYGNKYERAVYNWYSGDNLEYLLNKKYKRFKGTLYVPQGESGSDTCQLKITADDKLLYTSPQMSKYSEPVKIDVDVSGHNVIKIYFTNNIDEFNSMWGGGICLCLGEASFYK